VKDLSAVTVERRWITSVLASLILGVVIVYITVRHVLDNFSAMTSNEYIIVLVAAIIITSVCFVAFIDFFAVDFSVRVRKQVSISKKELMERKRRSRLGDEANV
jgi:hypothetical protein